MSSFYLDPGGIEAYAVQVADRAHSVLGSIPAAAPSGCDGELDQAVGAVFRIAAGQFRTAGTALVGQARAARSAVRLYQLTERRLQGRMERLA